MDTSNSSIVGAVLTIRGRESVPFRSLKHGEYYRILMPGTYWLMVMFMIFYNMFVEEKLDRLLKWKSLVLGFFSVFPWNMYSSLLCVIKMSS